MLDERAVTTRRRGVAGSPVRLLLAAVAVISMTAGCGGSPLENNRRETPDLAVEHYTLGNGLEVLLRRDERVPIASINLQYHVGPANEGAGRTGFAHLFEHMMFQGSGHTGPDTYFAHLEAAGATNVNATTGYDETTYTEDVPANALELALWLESDRMGFLLDSLDQAQLSNQQSVVRNERRQSVESVPYGLSGEAVYQLLFPPGHPYHAGIIGSHLDIEAAQLDDVRDFFARYYVPNNASLAIVGNIDIAATKALIQEYFGSIPRGLDPREPQVVIPRPTHEQRLTVTDEVQLPAVTMAWVTPSIYTPGDAEAEIAASVLAGSKTSRLYQSLVHRTGIAQDVSASQRSLRYGSVFSISATATPGHTAEELEAAIQHELDALAASGPSPSELSATKTVIRSGALFGLEHPAAVADLANRYERYFGDPNSLARDLARYAAVDAAGVQRFAAQQLTRDRRVVVDTVPGVKTLPPDPPAPPAAVPAPPSTPKPASREEWRNTVPKPGPSPAIPLPTAQRFQLDNGLPIYLVESHGLPLGYAALVSRWGSATDPTDRPGLAALTLDMLDEGTSTQDALGITREMQSLGGALSTSVGVDSSSVGVAAPAAQLGPAMSVLSDVVRSPAFPPEELERIRGEYLVGQKQSRDDPSAVAATVMYHELFGGQHPFGHIDADLTDGLAAISRQDLQRFHDAAFNPQTSALILAGDLTADQARALATEHFGNWHGSGTNPPTPPPATPSPERLFVVDQPGAGQTTLLLAQPGVRRADPDVAKLTVMNTVLGGGFNSRINLNLRERHGYTYGASSALSPYRDLGVITLQANTQTAVTGAAAQELLAEVKAIREDPISPEELAMAKDSLRLSLPASFTTSSETAAAASQLFIDNLPPDYYQRLAAEIADVDAADVQAVARVHLQPDQMKIVAVGDRAQLDPQLAAAKLGPIAYRTTDGTPAAQQ
jgi:zinc protease